MIPTTSTPPARRQRPAPLEVTVVGVEEVGGGFVRVTFGGDQLAAFQWPGAASHLKFFPGGTVPSDAPGAAGDEAPRPISRTYTPRRFDPEARTLEIDFLLHGEGVASSWARSAAPGEPVRVSIPRASYRPDPTASRLLLAGDDSAIPAIATILEANPQRSTTVVIERVTGSTTHLPLPEHAGATFTFVEADDDVPGAALEAALATLASPDPEVATWVACEATAVRRIRSMLLEQGAERERLVTRGYWRLGAANHPDHDFGEDDPR